MSYTNYGLLTGLIYVSVTILIIMLYMLYVLKTRPHQKNYIITSMILYMILVTLDTVWWIFDIKTNIVDFLITQNNSTEQVTIFGVMSYICIIQCIIIHLKHQNINKEKRDNKHDK